MNISTNDSNFFGDISEDFNEDTSIPVKPEPTPTINIIRPNIKDDTDVLEDDELDDEDIEEENDEGSEIEFSISKVIDSDTNTQKNNQTIIADETIIEGNVKSKHNVILGGWIKEGTLKTGGSITVLPTGICDNGIYAKENILIQKQINDKNKYINGPIQGKNIVIDGGFIQGNVKAEGTLTLEKNSVIIGDVQAENLILKGAIKGNIIIKNNIEVKDSAIVKGTITTATINMNENAVLDCTLTLTNKKKIDLDTIFKITE